mmetsp:Transcript_90716/g.157262  ORF Transcript_90716/g.157262 Transcript_90716/m.157262 type:complete len:97 (+) Transcript_90716:390-680(+)
MASIEGQQRAGRQEAILGVAIWPQAAEEEGVKAWDGRPSQSRFPHPLSTPQADQKGYVTTGIPLLAHSQQEQEYGVPYVNQVAEMQPLPACTAQPI